MVVLPTYNEMENLPRMVQAIFALGVPGMEILVVDDNSPDGTGRLADEIAQANPERVRVLQRVTGS